jgi:hypothetical protein
MPPKKLKLPEGLKTNTQQEHDHLYPLVTNPQQPTPEPVEAPPRDDEPEQETAPKRGRPKKKGSFREKVEAGDFVGMKVYIPTDLHTRVKLASVHQRRDMSEIVAEALDKHLDS